MNADRTPTLDDFEHALRGSLAAVEAAPFLGHHPCPIPAREALAARLDRSNLLRSLRGLLWKWPALTAAWIASHVRDRYGEEDDHRFWSLLDELFGRVVRGDERATLAELFTWACAKLDLARSVAGSHVDRIVVQAGAPLHQLDVLVRRCLEVERAEGLPDLDDDPACQRFTAAVAERLRPTNPRLARVLEADPTSWYLRRWIAVRLGREDPADPAFVEVLRERLEALPEPVGSTGSPTLVWAEGGLAIRMPRPTRGRIRLEAGGRSFGLEASGAEEEVFLAELATGCGLRGEVRWVLEGDGPTREGILALPANDGSELLLFSLPAGKLVRRVAFSDPAARCAVPAGRLLAVAAGRFTTPEGPAETFDGWLRVAELALDDERIRLRRGALGVELEPLERPRIELVGRPAFMALGGEVVHAGPEPGVRIRHRAENDRGSYEILVEIDGTERGRLPLRFEEGVAEARLEPAMAVEPARLMRCRLALVRAGERRALARASFLVWNRLEAAAEGRFHGPPPENLCPRGSRHFLIDRDGVALRRDERYLEAVLAFDVGGDRIELRLPAPDPVALVERRDPDGRVARQILDPVEAIVVQPGDPRLLEIRCPDPEAELRLGNRRTRGAFRYRPAFRCSLLAAAEHCRSADPTLAVRLSSGNEFPLGRLTVATEALEWQANRDPADHTLEVLGFRLREPVGLLRLHAEDLFAGTRITLDLPPDGLDRVDPGTGLRVRLHPDLGRPPHAYSLDVPRAALPRGLWLVRFEVSEGDTDRAGQLRVPSNPRGDSFGWLVENPPEDLASRDLESSLGITGTVGLFTRASRALLRCWALPAWQGAGLERLGRWWRRAAGIIDHHPERERVIAALLPLAFEDPPADAAPSWMPILGFWHAFTDHLALPAVHFADLARGGDPAAQRLAATAEVARSGGLSRALSSGLSVDPAFLGCFENLAAASARRGAEELLGFDLAAWARKLPEAAEALYHEHDGPILAPADFAAALRACRRRWDLVRASGGFGRHRPTAMATVTAATRWLRRQGKAQLRKQVPGLRGEGPGPLLPTERTSDALFAELPEAISAVALACRLEPRRRGTLDAFLKLVAEQGPDRERVLDGLQFLWGLAREVFAFWLTFWELLLATGDRRA